MSTKYRPELLKIGWKHQSIKNDPSVLSVLFKPKNSNNRAQRFKLDEIRRILEIMSSNRVDNEDEVSYLSGLLRQANITSNHGRYELLMDAVITCGVQSFWITSNQSECGHLVVAELFGNDSLLLVGRQGTRLQHSFWNGSDRWWILLFF